MTKQLVRAETSSKPEVCSLTRSWGWETPRIVYASRVPPRPTEGWRPGEMELRKQQLNKGSVVKHAFQEMSCKNMIGRTRKSETIGIVKCRSDNLRKLSGFDTKL